MQKPFIPGLPAAADTLRHFSLQSSGAAPSAALPDDMDNATTMFARRHYRLAAGAYREILARDGDNHLARAWLVLSLLGNDELPGLVEPEARKAFNGAYKDDDANLATMDPVIIHAFCSALVQAHRDDEAESYIDAALEARPHDRLLRYSRARLLWKQPFHNPRHDIGTLHGQSLGILGQLEASHAGAMSVFDVMIVEDLVDHLQDEADRLYENGNFIPSQVRVKQAEKLLQKHHPLTADSHQLAFSQFQQIRRDKKQKHASCAPQRQETPLAVSPLSNRLYNLLLPLVMKDLDGPHDFSRQACKLHKSFCRVSVAVHGDNDPVRDRLVAVSPDGDELETVVRSRRRDFGLPPRPRSRPRQAPAPVRFSGIATEKTDASPLPVRPATMSQWDDSDAAGLLKILGNTARAKPPTAG